jgi:DUF4097 and DUF4098 domain-containing protein YvlB
MGINKTLFSILIMFISVNSFTQEGTLVLAQDHKLTKLMELKKEVNSVDFTSGQYTVQVFNGQYEKGIELVEELMSNEKFKDVYFSFETPYYKIRIGKFVSKIEAIKELQKIKKTFPSAFILKPN